LYATRVDGWTLTSTEWTDRQTQRDSETLRLRVRVRVRVTLQLTVSQSVSLGVEPNLGLLTRDFFFKVTVLSFGGALSDQRSGLSFVSLLSI
jgi:hypothetical protein